MNNVPAYNVPGIPNYIIEATFEWLEAFALRTNNPILLHLITDARNGNKVAIQRVLAAVNPYSIDTSPWTLSADGEVAIAKGGISV
jgi:hypothetical protein